VIEMLAQKGGDGGGGFCTDVSNLTHSPFRISRAKTRKTKDDCVLGCPISRWNPQLLVQNVAREVDLHRLVFCGYLKQHGCSVRTGSSVLHCAAARQGCATQPALDPLSQQTGGHATCSGARIRVRVWHAWEVMCPATTKMRSAVVAFRRCRLVREPRPDVPSRSTLGPVRKFLGRPLPSNGSIMNQIISPHVNAKGGSVHLRQTCVLHRDRYTRINSLLEDVVHVSIVSFNAGISHWRGRVRYAMEGCEEPMRNASAVVGSGAAGRAVLR
jgi:hypothetical protein